MKEVNIKENWEKIEELEKRAIEKTGDPQAKFNASHFFFDGNRHLLIPIMYRNKVKRHGKEDFTKGYKEIMCEARYCPFTGKPLYKKVESSEKAEG